MGMFGSRDSNRWNAVFYADARQHLQHDFALPERHLQLTAAAKVITM
jgi:hypothetical protein